jgi:hypothetical protein
MNTPKQKAVELIKKFSLLHRGEKESDWIDKNITFNYLDQECALIVVEQMQLIMDSLWKIQGTNEGEKSSYLLEVIKEIEKYEQ